MKAVDAPMRSPFRILAFLLSGMIPLTGRGNAQEYLWPTDAGTAVTSSFGEYRPDHFHAGIDVKTWGNIGYQVFAIGSGSIVRLRVSPYGYGRAVYLKLDHGITAIYAHLMRFSDPLEELIRETQNQKGKFEIECTFPEGRFPVRAGELVGLTGRSGTRDPHLHFEVRDSENRPFNPLALGYPHEDATSPEVVSLAVTPLCAGSHVDGDFLPRVYEARKENHGSYRVRETINAWGPVGFSIQCYDRADGASNRFAVYQLVFFVDDQRLFSSRYDLFPYEQSWQVDLDRDFRLMKWGWGLFQKLYIDPDNTLPFYEREGYSGAVFPAEAGNADPAVAWQPCVAIDKAAAFTKGEHPFAIVCSDFAGNRTRVEGTLQFIPIWDLVRSGASFSVQDASEGASELPPVIDLDSKFLDDRIRFRLTSELPLGTAPSLILSINYLEAHSIPLYRKDDRTYVGAMVWPGGTDGTLSLEARWPAVTGLETVLRDTLHVFSILPEKGGTLVSPDGRCRLQVPARSVIRPAVGVCEIEPCVRPEGMLGIQYRFSPSDVLMKGRARVSIQVPGGGGNAQGIGLYQISSTGNASSLGGTWEGDRMISSAGGMGTYTVLRDTSGPQILFIRPSPVVKVDSTPRVSVGFADTLSGVYGEENYRVFLDGKPLIMEYDPAYDMAFHDVETPLESGTHGLEIRLKDNAGNEKVVRGQFIVR